MKRIFVCGGEQKKAGESPIMRDLIICFFRSSSDGEYYRQDQVQVVETVYNFSGKISVETTTIIMCRWGDNNKMDIKKMGYVKKKNFICVRSGSIVKHYEFIFQEKLYFVNPVNKN
jgi:hypothetical protein